MTQKQTLTKAEEIKRVIPLAGGRQLPLSRTLVMGVLNVTPDSFYDGGRYNSVSAGVHQALRMQEEGADLIDIGGESSRPAGVYSDGATPVDAEEETRRVIPVIEAIRRETDICLSVDTYRAGVAEAALDAGADIVNDITALRGDERLGKVVAARGVPIVLMHMKGRPQNMQLNPSYGACVGEILDFFAERLTCCEVRGIERRQVIVDPGIGFGKRLSDNLEILSHLGRFRELGCPVLIGASRKSFLGQLSDSMSAPEKRLSGSLASAVMAVLNGADILRVHDVEPTVQAIKVVRAIREAV